MEVVLDSDDLLPKILSYLDVFDIPKCSVVCRSWSVAARSETLWTAFLVRDFAECFQGGQDEGLLSSREQYFELCTCNCGVFYW